MLCYFFLVPAQMDNTAGSRFAWAKSSSRRSVCQEKCQHSKEFLYMDNREWNSEALPQKVYKDPVQSGVRTVISRALVEAFDLFK